MKQSGAVEACWAHNSEVGRSKLPSANLISMKLKEKFNQHIFFFNLLFLCHLMKL